MTRPNTCRIGTNTAGNLSQTRKLRLPNYWTVEIPYQRCFSHDGKLYEGTGIPPNKEVKMMDFRSFGGSGGAKMSRRNLKEAAEQEEEVRGGERMQEEEEEEFDPFIKKAVEHIMNVSHAK